MKRQKGIPPKVLEQARRLSTEAKPREKASPERPTSALVRQKIVAALKKLHPMD